jgi:uncharacterized membrane protein YagU involved in acid resistance
MLARGLGSEASNEGLVSGLKISQFWFIFHLIYGLSFGLGLEVLAGSRPRIKVWFQASQALNFASNFN